jgi:hypothetical protein
LLAIELSFPDEIDSFLLPTPSISFRGCVGVGSWIVSTRRNFLSPIKSVIYREKTYVYGAVGVVLRDDRREVVAGMARPVDHALDAMTAGALALLHGLWFFS